MPPNDGSRYRFLSWSGTQKGEIKRPLRILLANDEVVRVYEVDNSQWKAVINGAASGLMGIANVVFGSDENEVLVFSNFGVKVTVWSLINSRGAEIRDPKSGESYDYRPNTRHLAILTRESVHDSLMLLPPGAHQASQSIELPTTDAQGVRWSPDGRWLAIWDAASSGFSVLIYTADGHLFRTYEGGQTSEKIGLGIKSVAWHPDAAFLVVGDYEDHATLLAKNTVSSNRLVFDDIDQMTVLTPCNAFPPVVHEFPSNTHLGGADR